MSFDPHSCLELAKTSDVIFYSKLWKSWAIKIFPANYDQMPEEYKQLPELQPIFKTIRYCCHCGENLK